MALYVYTTVRRKAFNGQWEYRFVSTKELYEHGEPTVNNSVQVGSTVHRVGKYCPVDFSTVKYY